MDGVSLMPAVRNPKRQPNRIVEIEAPRPLFEQDVPVNAWDRPYKGVRTDRYTYVRYTEAGDEELYDRRLDPGELLNRASDPAYAKIKAHLAAKLTKLDKCHGKSCRVSP
jgi:arylsulfatase A-like enzyme